MVSDTPASLGPTKVFLIKVNFFLPVQIRRFLRRRPVQDKPELRERESAPASGREKEARDPLTAVEFGRSSAVPPINQNGCRSQDSEPDRAGVEAPSELVLSGSPDSVGV